MHDTVGAEPHPVYSDYSEVLMLAKNIWYEKIPRAIQELIQINYSHPPINATVCDRFNRYTVAVA